MKKKLKVGIIGCGRVAIHYAQLIKKNKIKHNNISCLSDTVISKANNLSKIIGGKVYKDYIKMILENKIDVALVLTPSGTHYQICKKLLEHNINVICEKPLTMTPSKSLELYKIAKKSSSRRIIALSDIGVGYNYLSPYVKKLYAKECKSVGRDINIYYYTLCPESFITEKI